VRGAHSGRRDQPVRLIVITPPAMAEESLAGGMGWRLAVTTDGCEVSLLFGVCQAAGLGAGAVISTSNAVAVTQARPGQIDAVRPVNDTIEDGVAESWVTKHRKLPPFWKGSPLRLQ
jgi:hypothetical protein